MARSSRPDPTSTFIVRLRAEWSPTGQRWRGHIEHVQSGEKAWFRDVEAMIGFIRRLTGWLDAEAEVSEAR